MLPSVTVIISAFNEAGVIEAKLENVLALDYPLDRLRVVVVSDASDDGTDELVRAVELNDSRVRLYRQEERLGKTSGLNAVMSSVDTDLVVFSDANAMYEPRALKQLVWPFHDGRVGYAVGAALYIDAPDDAAAEKEGQFWNFELAQKQSESDFDSVVGGDGAIYAIRRELYWPLAADDINDFVNPLQIVARGYRGVFCPAARCFESAGDSFEKEFRRKRRIVNRSWRAVLRYLNRISPLSRPRFCFCIFSHKVIRWFGAPLIMLALASALALVWAGGGAIYALAAAAISATMVAAAAGWLLDRLGAPVPRLLVTPYYFYLALVAALLGIVDQHRGVKHVTWQHVRSD